MARVNDGSHSFTCHPHPYPRMEWATLPLIPSRSASTHFGPYSRLAQTSNPTIACSQKKNCY